MKKRIEKVTTSKNVHSIDWEMYVINTINALIQAQEEMEKRVNKIANWLDIDNINVPPKSEPKEECLCKWGAATTIEGRCIKCGELIQ